MKSIFEVPPSERFRIWKDFRSTLMKLDDSEILTATAKFWGNVPTVNFYVDWDDHTTWPTPWEIIHEGQMCPTAVAICMYHTLRLIEDERWIDRIKMSLIKDSEKGMILVVTIDNNFVINYAYDEVSEISCIQGIVEEYVYLDGKYRII